VERVAAPDAPIPLSDGDLDVLTSDVGPAPFNIGVLLELPDVGPDQVPTIAEVLADRIRAVPAMGRAIHRQSRHLFWIDQPHPQPLRHIRVLDARGGDAALDHAGRLLTTPLDLATPPWAIDLIVEDHGVSVVFVAHHVLTGGLHGLAMLTALTDCPQGPAPQGPRQRPQDGDPARLASGPSTDPAPQRAAGTPSRWRRPHLAPRTSLNRPTGPTRGITTHDIALQDVRSAAHRAHVTVNDLLLVATSQAVAGELGRRGEHPHELMVWVPVAPAPTPRDTPAETSNALGVMLVAVDLRAALPDRLAQVSAYTSRRKPSARQPASMRAAHLISQASGRLGLAWGMNQHQRIGNTSLSTMRGPAELHLAGHPIRRIVPAGSRAANVGVSFLALSYADTLTISIVHDPAQLPDPTPMLADLATTLQDLLP
jgi:diacylglycerol O-acyltransferase / wax synthase